MTGRRFFDTNVFLYAHDHDEPAKRAVAVQLIAEHVIADEIVVSAQVLQEFYVNATKKLRRPIASQAAVEAVRQMAVLPVIPISSPLVLEAIAASSRFGISYWDALIVETARAAGCDRVLSEDLQDGRDYDGVRVENPFTPRS